MFSSFNRMGGYWGSFTSSSLWKLRFKKLKINIESNVLRFAGILKINTFMQNHRLKIKKIYYKIKCDKSLKSYDQVEF